jgi:long-chain acyl-CoA synthetase
VGIISNNRWEWATIAAAAYSLNATIVPMYEAQLAADWTYILNDSGCTALFCANDEIYNQVQKDVLPSTPSVKSVLCLDAPEGEPHAFATAMANASTETQSLIVKPTQDDLADLIYTSGTTGKQKWLLVGIIVNQIRILTTLPLLSSHRKTKGSRIDSFEFDEQRQVCCPYHGGGSK